MLIHEWFLVFTKRHFHVVVFSVGISAAIDVPVGCFLSQAAITGA
jgi:ABC-type proline/glycine betaine transport system permease subunit